MPLKKIYQNVDKIRYTWKVEHINEIFSQIDPDKVNFPDFPIQETYQFSTEVENHTVKWDVTLKFCDNELVGGFMIFFDAAKDFVPKNHVTCNFYLVDADKNEIFLGRKNRKFDSAHSLFPVADTSTLSYCLELPNTIDKLLPNDTMILLIELITYLDDDPIFPYEHMTYTYDPDHSLSDDFSKLYKVQDGCDVMIDVQGVKFPVHKKVLEARCPKLYKTINHQQVTLMYIKPKIFKRVLEFMYTRKIEDLDDHAEDLLEAASNYELTRLKNLCEFSLMENYLTCENSEEVEKLAKSFGATQLANNAFLLRENTRSFKPSGYFLTPSGTLIPMETGEKEVYEHSFENDICTGEMKFLAD